MSIDSIPPGPGSVDRPEITGADFKRVQELSPDGFMIFRSVRDEAGRIVDFTCIYANPAAQNSLGYTSGSLAGRRLRAAFPALRASRLLKRCVEVVETGNPLKATFRRRDRGGACWFRITVVRLEDGFAATLFDITRTIRAGKARSRKVALLEATGEGIYGLDLDGRCTFVNSSAASMLGYAREEMLGQPVHSLIHHHRADGSPYPVEECPVHQALRSGASQKLHDEVLWRKDGTSIPVESSVSPLIRRNQIDGAVVAFTDITTLKQAEHELRIRARQQAAVAELGFHALAGWDTEMLLRRATALLQGALELEYTGFFEPAPNRKTVLLREGSGWGETQVGKAILSVAPEDYAGHLLLARDPVVVVDFTRETRFQAPALFADMGIVSGIGVAVSGRDRQLGILAAYTTTRREFRRDEVELLQSIGNVLAQAIEHKRAEEALREGEKQFRQAQKMEAVGRLAGGVAHDFNNLLTVINGNAELGLMEISEVHPLREPLEEITKAAARASDLTRQLLAFSRRQVLQPKVFNLNVTVSTMEKLLRRVIGENVQLQLRLDPDLGLIQADPGQLEQVLVNLVVNARDAMPRGGRLTIESGNVTVDGASQHKYPKYVQPGAYVCLSTRDTGIGMDDETLLRLFEPFFTTKEPGQGTGLGLSTVYGIIKQSEGYVWAQSVPGNGSTFTILLPRVMSEASAADPEAGGEEKPTGLETVLLVEDEPAVRNLTRRILVRRGYTVLEAGDVEEALRICDDHAGPIELALTDVILPGLSGRDLAERLAVISPQTKVLYMSGYTADVIAQHGVLEPGMQLLEKPFSPATLLRRVREILDADRESASAGG